MLPTCCCLPIPLLQPCNYSTVSVCKSNSELPDSPPLSGYPTSPGGNLPTSPYPSSNPCDNSQDPCCPHTSSFDECVLSSPADELCSYSGGGCQPAYNGMCYQQVRGAGGREAGSGRHADMQGTLQCTWLKDARSHQLQGLLLSIALACVPPAVQRDLLHVAGLFWLLLVRPIAWGHQTCLCFSVAPSTASLAPVPEFPALTLLPPCPQGALHQPHLSATKRQHLLLFQ